MHSEKTMETPPPHTCPVWLGHVLANPLRRLFENPTRLVLPLVKPGDRVLELGPAMGFFSLPVAAAIGPTGRLVCVDVQEGMLKRLRRRLEKKGLLPRAELRLCSAENFGLDDDRGSFDVALALHVVHETPSVEATLRTLSASLKPGGKLLLVEPPGHCSPELFQREVTAAENEGLVSIPHPRVAGRKNLALWKKLG